MSHFSTSGWQGPPWNPWAVEYRFCISSDSTRAPWTQYYDDAKNHIVNWGDSTLAYHFNETHRNYWIASQARSTVDTNRVSAWSQATQVEPLGGDSVRLLYPAYGL